MAKSKSKHKKRSSSDSDSLSSYKMLKKKRKQSNVSSESSDSDTCKRKAKMMTAACVRQERKERKKLKRLQKKLKKLDKKKNMSSDDEVVGPSVSSISAFVESEKQQVPLTKDQFEQQQKEVRREFDPSSGRTRLVKGSGEIIEEIVSKQRQKEINKQATVGDGIFYQKQAGLL